jgi:hypothetical protein
MRLDWQSVIVDGFRWHCADGDGIVTVNETADGFDLTDQFEVIATYATFDAAIAAAEQLIKTDYPVTYADNLVAE